MRVLPRCSLIIVFLLNPGVTLCQTLDSDHSPSWASADALNESLDQDGTHAERALAAAREGRFDQAAADWDAIASGSRRDAVARELLSIVQGAPLQGGGTLADFQPLIDLITTTVAPDSWAANGGQGALMGFPAGVHVDAAGCLHSLQANPMTALKVSIQRSAQRTTHGEVPEKTTPLRKISLPRLERAAFRRILAGQPLTLEMQTLAGLHRISHILIDPRYGDLILAGPYVEGSANLSFDALAAVWHNQFHGEGRLGCCIEPTPQGLAEAQQFIQTSAKKPIPSLRRAAWAQELGQRLGRQRITVHGIDPRSQAARIIVAADYHMKRIGLGFEPSIPEVPSYLDSIDIDRDGSVPPLDVLRWWFVLDYQRIAIDRSETVFILSGRGARLQCENEFLNDAGVRVHTGQADPRNIEFAARFTRHLDQLADLYPVYRQLQGLCDLAMAVAIIRHYDLAGRIDWAPSLLPLGPAFCLPGAAIPKEVETITRIRELSPQVYITAASGGVEIAAGPVLQRRRVRATRYERDRVQESSTAPESYRANGRWYWD